MKNQIHSIDTIHHIANVIKDIRNKKRQNQEDLELGSEDVTYNEYWAIFNISDEKNYFIQILTKDDKTLYAEVPNKFPDEYKLSTTKINKLKSLGWMESISKKTVQNYFNTYDVSDETACYETAALIVLTMISVFDYKTYEPINIKIDLFENDPNTIRKITILDKAKNITRNILLLLAEKLNK